MEDLFHVDVMTVLKLEMAQDTMKLSPQNSPNNTQEPSNATVDGSEIRRSPPGMNKTLKIFRDKLPTVSTGEPRISEASTAMGISQHLTLTASSHSEAQKDKATKVT